MGRPDPTGLNGRHGPEKWPTNRTMGRTLGPQHGGGPTRSARGPTRAVPARLDRAAGRADPARCTSIPSSVKIHIIYQSKRIHVGVHCQWENDFIALNRNSSLFLNVMSKPWVIGKLYRNNRRLTPL